MYENVIIKNRDFRRVIFKKKTVILNFYIKENLIQGKFYRRTRLVTCSTCKIRLVAPSTCLITRSTHGTRLPTGSTCSSIRSTCLPIRSTRLYTCNILSVHFSTCSTIYQSFDDWLILIFVNRELEIVLN